MNKECQRCHLHEGTVSCYFLWIVPIYICEKCEAIYKAEILRAKEHYRMQHEQKYQEALKTLRNLNEKE